MSTATPTKRKQRAKVIPAKLVDWSAIQALYVAMGGQAENVARAHFPDADNDFINRFTQTIRKRASLGNWLQAISKAKEYKSQQLASISPKQSLSTPSPAELAARVQENNKTLFLHKSGHALAKTAQALADKADTATTFEDHALLMAAFEPAARVGKTIFSLGQENTTNVNVQVNALSGFKPLNSGDVIDV